MDWQSHTVMTALPAQHLQACELFSIRALLLNQKTSIGS
jgi:hypothetical protein